MAYRNKTYVSFDGDKDIHYYRLMLAWKQNDRSSFNFYDAHDLNTAFDSSQERTIKTRLAERLRNSKVLVLLIGEQTRYLYKFVRWEIEQSLSMDIPVIAVNLNGKRFIDDNRCPPILKNEMVIHISFNPAIMQHALERWPDTYSKFRREGKSGPFYYTEEVYRRLGL